MINSMTGYATKAGNMAQTRWAWELRGVNGKGLDLRLRLPDWIDGLEAAVRPMLSKAIGRGNVTLGLRITREEAPGAQSLNIAQADAMIDALQQISARAQAAGVTLAPTSAADVLALRGVLDTSQQDGDAEALKAALLADLPAVLAAFNDMRGNEGAALAQVLHTQLDEVARLTDAAAAVLDARRDALAQTLRRNLAKVMEAAPDADEPRVAQELALIAVKSDVTEEIDRLRAHVSAARDLLGTKAPVGRKLDFLMQEFNREANTLCSKAQMKDLTETGLALKVVIDQMREQVQNVE